MTEAGQSTHTTHKTKNKGYTMAILHTIECTQYVASFNAHEQFTRHLTRNRKLTERGIERMFSRGCNEYEANPDINVTRVQTAVYQK